MQVTTVNQTQPQQTSPISASALPETPGTSFSDIMAPILNQAPPGPEPPGPPPAATAGEEEAAVAPNATPQKLDSPRPIGKSVGQAVETLPTGTALFNLSVISASTPNAPIKTRRGEAEGTAQMQAVGSVKSTTTKTVGGVTAEKSSLAQSAAQVKDAVANLTSQTDDAADSVANRPLPTDADAPIVSVQSQVTQVQSPAVASQPANQSVAAVTTAPAPIATLNVNVGSKGDPDSQISTTGVASVTPGGSASSTGGSASGSAGQSTPDRTPNPQMAVAPASAASQTQKAAPAELTALTGASRAEMVKQVADKIQLLAAGRSQASTVVQLTPKALGMITLTVRNLNGSIDAQISASNDHVRTALEHSRPDLAGAIQAKGYQVGTISVSGGSSKSSSQTPNEQPQKQNGGSKNFSPSTDQTAAQAESAPSQTTARAVDVWI